MSGKDRALPKPPNTPFGRKRNLDETGATDPLMADRLAMAMAEGKLDEFLQKELPDNEQARKLAELMMGMTGMSHSKAFPGKPGRKKKVSSKTSEAFGKAKSNSALQPPEDIVQAAKLADVKGLMELLKREHKKQQASDDTPADNKNKDAFPFQDQAVIEKEVIDRFIKIAFDNHVSFDWLFFRALTRYVQEYQKTGEL